MKQRYSILISLVLILSSYCSFAGPTGNKKASAVARNFLYERIPGSYNRSYDNLVISSINPVTRNHEILYYVVNFEQGGYVIVSGNDVLTPVIGYSFEGSFSMENQPGQLRYWMQHYEDEIEFHYSHATEATAAIESEWSRLSGSFQGLQKFKGKDVSPFLPCNWDQGKYYNEYCPVDAGGDAGHVYVGCVATAMAQVMMYYRYPLQGTGTHTYTHPTYGTMTVNYGNTTYEWEGAMNQLSACNHTVALISYHAGVAINMNYGPDGSGANTQDASLALKQHFGYGSSTQFVQRMSYSNQAWKDLFHTNIDQKRPCMYSGHPSNGGDGHCWVTDGYQGTDYFHMNWGWSGGSNGYFTLDNLNPAGAGDFNSGHGAVVGIYPGGTYPYGCSGMKTISNSTSGTIEDGSHTDDYSANSNCSWLIAPLDSIKSIKLTFHRFNTEAGNDLVRVYGGTTTSDTLLATYSGSTLPSNLNYNGNKMLITFETDGSNQADGFYLTYSSTLPTYCSSKMLTTLTGTITDGSGSYNYQSNTICTWIIQPPGVGAVTLNFTSFDLEPVNDYLRIYDLTTEELLATYSGSNLPPTVTTHTGGMYIEFKTNGSVNRQGWTADYSSFGVGLNEINHLSNLSCFPNPTSGTFTLNFNNDRSQILNLIIISTDGKTVYHETETFQAGEIQRKIDLSSLPSGIYILRIQGDQDLVTHKLILE